MEDKMKKSWLRYLGFLGFLSLLSLFTSNIGYLGFLGFLAFFTQGMVIRDERLEANLNKAARNAFVVSVIVYVIATLIVALTSKLSIFIYAFPLNFALLILTFAFSFQFYERRE
jgi:hypothetical protein